MTLSERGKGRLRGLQDRFKFTIIAHANRAFLGPYSAETLRDMVPEPGFVLDVGCGKGAGLQALGGNGLGIDINQTFATEAKERNPDAEILIGEALPFLESLSRKPDLIVCMGASQAVGTPSEAITLFANLLHPGGKLLFGDGYWRQKPHTDYLVFLGAKESDVGQFEDTKHLGEQLGLTHLRSYASTHDDWDAYESSYQQTVLDWCDTHFDDPDAANFRERIDAWRNAYLKWGRQALGFGIHLFRKA